MAREINLISTCIHQKAPVLSCAHYCTHRITHLLCVPKIEFFWKFWICWVLKKAKRIAEGGFDPPTFGLWAQRAPAVPLCWCCPVPICFKRSGIGPDINVHGWCAEWLWLCVVVGACACVCVCVIVCVCGCACACACGCVCVVCVCVCVCGCVVHASSEWFKTAHCSAIKAVYSPLALEFSRSHCLKVFAFRHFMMPSTLLSSKREIFYRSKWAYYFQ